MHRIKKLLWMIFIIWFIFFIICDEKWYKIEWKSNHLVFDKTEKKSDYIGIENETKGAVIYKNSDMVHMFVWLINPDILRKSDGIDPEFFKTPIPYKNSKSVHIYSWFENPIALYESDGIDTEFLAKIEREKAEEKALDESLKYKWPDITPLDDTNTISNIFWSGQNNIPVPKYSWFNQETILLPAKPDAIYTDNSSNESEINRPIAWFINPEERENISWKWWEIKNNFSWNNTEMEIITSKSEIINNNIPDTWDSNEDSKSWNTLDLKEVQEKFNQFSDLENTRNVKEIVNQSIKEDNDVVIPTITETIENEIEIKEWKTINVGVNIRTIEKLTGLIRDIGEKMPEITNSDDLIWDNENDWKMDEEMDILPTKIENEDVEILDNWNETTPIKYEVKRFPALNLKNSKIIEHDFVIDEDNVENDNSEEWLSDEVIEDLISSDEIDFNTLESENDEFLQEIFRKTKNTDIMNLIVETYLSEYQFVKAKNFIESISEPYIDDLNPLLNLQVAFNSFALTSNTIDSVLTSLVENYKLKNQISEEDRLRYLWVISLIQKDYDHFFELSNNFTSDKHKNFTAKLQGYKDQIAKQMWMPDYYFDTLVSLELFNQWFFQPAKILALSSLRQNSSYILPYQVLAYANFLTNSRDTSIEYMKKLVDLDPNNAEKYRFLMWIAYYRDKKYEQSVVMLSSVKHTKLRLDSDRYLIRNYILLDQKNKLISMRNKILWYDGLVASDFYTYFYESFYHPYSEWKQYQIYAFDTELANKMIRVCSMKLQEDEKAVCNYWMIGKNIALWQFEWLEESLLNLARQYPQWYLYQALGEYYIQQGDLDKAKRFLLRAISMTQRTPEVVQIKKLLQETI